MGEERPLYRQHQALGEASPFPPGCTPGSWAREEVCAAPLPILQRPATEANLHDSYMLQGFHSSLLLAQRRRNPEGSIGAATLMKQP